MEARQIPGPRDLQELGSRVGQCDAQRSTEDSQEEALGEGLDQQPPSGRPQGGLNRGRAFSGLGPDQKEVSRSEGTNRPKLMPQILPVFGYRSSLKGIAISTAYPESFSAKAQDQAASHSRSIYFPSSLMRISTCVLSPLDMNQ